MNVNQSHGLLCKPGNHSNQNEFFFTIFYPAIQALVSIRSLDLKTDLELIDTWVNQPYAKRFWQMNGSRDRLIKTYQSALANPNTHSFIGLINHKPSFQIDAYSVEGDELNEHIDTQEHDTGLHMLMAPPKELKKGWSLAALKAFQEYYFSFPAANRLFGEPDQENVAANRLSLRAGFQFVKEIAMSYKTANLYCITRSHYRILRSSSPLNNIL